MPLTAVELRLREAPPISPKCKLMPLPGHAKHRRYLAYDLNSDGVSEYFVENYAGAHSIGFALVDRTGSLLTRQREVGEIGGDRLVVLNSRHCGYYDIVCSYSDPGGVRGNRWEFNGTRYVKRRAFEYKGLDRSKAYIEKVQSAARACWYSDVFGRPPKAAKAAGRRRSPATTSAFSPTTREQHDLVQAPLGKGVFVRCEADSAQELAARVKPTCTWDGTDMLWVKRDGKGKLSFTLDRAYLYRNKAGLKKWVLFDFRRRRGPVGQFGGAYLRRTFSIGHSVPTSSAGPGNYAVVASRGPDGQVLYRLGWQAMVSGGSNNYIANSTIFLLKDRQGRWRVVGLGVTEGSGHVGHPVCFSVGARYRINWTGREEEPVRISLTRVVGDYEVGEEPMGALDLTIRRDGTLVTTPSFGIKWTGGEYIVPARGDTLGRIAMRLAWWRPFMMPKEGYRHQGAEVWLELLQKRNPGLPEGVLPASTRVQVPSRRAFGEAMKARQAGKAGISQFVETRRGLKSVWGVDIQLDRLTFRREVKPGHIKIFEAKYGRDLKRIMTWAVSRGRKRLRIRFKPGMGDFGTGNGVTVHIDKAALAGNSKTGNRLEWSIQTDIH